MLVLISEVISNSNAVIRQDFRKLRFQMIDDTLWVQMENLAATESMERTVKTAEMALTANPS